MRETARNDCPPCKWSVPNYRESNRLNNFAISSAGIGEAMQRSSSAMRAANNTIDETIALITAANTIIQNPESVGTTLRTISMYLRAAKTEAEEAGESTDGMAQSVSKLREEILTLTHNKVDIQIDANNFKSTYEILKELSEVWNELQDVDQANILERIGGKRNANVVSALLTNFSVAEDALKTSLDAAGSAEKENEKYLDSINGRLSILKASFQTLSSDVVDSDLIKFFVSAGTWLIDLIDKVMKLVGALGGIKSVIALLTTFLLTTEKVKLSSKLTSLLDISKIQAFTKAVGTNLAGAVQSLVSPFKNAVQAVKAYQAGMETAQAATQAVVGAITGAVSVAIIAISVISAAVAEVKRKQEEAQQKIHDAGTEARTTSEEIGTLALQYTALDNALYKNRDTRESMADVQSQIIEKLGLERYEVDALRDSYGDLSSAIQGASLEKLKDAELDLRADSDEYAKSLKKVAESVGNVFKVKKQGNLQNRTSEDLKWDADTSAAEKALVDAGYISLGTVRDRRYTTGKQARASTSSTTMIFDDWDLSTVDGIIAAYNNLKDALKLVEDQAGTNNGVYQSLYEQYKELGEAVGNYTDSISALNDNLAKQYAIEQLQGKRVPVTKEEFDEYKNGVVSAAVASGEFIGTEQEIESAIDNVLKNESAFAKFYAEAAETVKKVSELFKTPKDIQDSIQALWDDSSFSDIKSQIRDLVDEYGKLSPEKLNELADSSDTLAEFLEIDGMNAEFLAAIFTEMASGGDGISRVTDRALKLNAALDGMSKSFDKVSEAKKQYDAAMSVTEKDEGFKSYADAFKTLNDQFVAGTTNSNTFWAAAEYIFGNDQLDAWGWSDGLDQIYDAMKRNAGIFEDADSAGAGFLDRLYEMDQAGELLNANGEHLLSIVKDADGSYQFDIAYENISKIADKMGLTEEAALACLQAISMWGNVDLYNIDEVMSALRETHIASGGDGFPIEGTLVNVGKLTEQLQMLGKTGKEIHDILGRLSDSGAILLDVTGDTDTLLSSLEELGVVMSDGGTIHIDYTALIETMRQAGYAKEDVEGLIQTLSGVDSTGAEEALKSLDGIPFYNITTKADTAADATNQIAEAASNVDAVTTDNATQQIDNITEAANTASNAVATIGANMEKIDGKTVTVNIDTNIGGGGLGRVMNLFGFKGGTENAPAGPALVGEEGPELRQHGSSAELVGTNGPEIVDLDRGDIIYTNPQTKRIFRKYSSRLHGRIPAYKAGRGASDKYWMELLDDNGDPGYTSKPKGGVSGSVSSGSGRPSLIGSSGSSGSGRSGGGSGGSSNDNWFTQQYNEHKHLIEMDKEQTGDFLNWLDDAYKKAYEEGIIDLDDYRKYEEEVYSGRKDQFLDFLNDTEHEISMRENFDGETNNIIVLYQNMIAAIEKEVENAHANGLDNNNEYVQNLQNKWISYTNAVKQLRENAEKDAKNSMEKLIDYRVDMLKQDIKDQKDALSKKLDYLKEFYDKQKEMLQDQYDEEKYLKDQADKRKDVTDIQSELSMLENDDSAWAQKRKLELQAELKDAQDTLDEFEKDHALDKAMDALDNAYDAQEKQINAEMDALEEKLNDPEALYNQALADIRNNTYDTYLAMIAFNRKYGTGKDEDVNDMWEDAYKDNEGYKGTHDGNGYKDIDLNNATNYQGNNGSYDNSTINPKPNTDSGTPSSGNQDSGQQSSAPSLEKGSTVTVKSTATKFGANSGNAYMSSFVPGSSFTVYGTDGDQVLIGRDGAYTGWINKSDIVGYKNGTNFATPGLHAIDEAGEEYIFVSPSDGTRYRMFSGGEKVLDAASTDFLYKFATSGGDVLRKMVDGLFNMTGLSKLMKPIQNIEINAGDVIVQGNASTQTVSEIRRAQRGNVDFMLKELKRLSV